jgi:NAD(P)-dependent dehydrogenase (short-subunit alcohol dehydrogenase family)
MTGRSPRGAAVTGSASGIGRGVALRLARDGFDVTCFDIDEAGAQQTADLIGEAGGKASARALNVTDEQAVDRAFADVEALAAFVHAAGVLHYQPALELPVAQWRHVVETNLTGTFLCDRAAAREMIGSGTPGRVVNIASVHSESPSVGLSHYDASKGGILMLTRNLALEWAAHGITVNAVGPGLVVNTRLGGGTSQEYLDSVIPAIPLGRAGQPDDIAGPVSFLCSTDASYVTGAILYVDGGMLLTART